MAVGAGHRAAGRRRPDLAPVAGGAVGRDAVRPSVVGLAAIVDIIVATTDDAPSLGPIAVVLGAGYLIAVVQQLVRQDGRAELVDALAATVTLATVASLGAAWVVLFAAGGRQLDHGGAGRRVRGCGRGAARARGRRVPSSLPWGPASWPVSCWEWPSTTSCWAPGLASRPLCRWRWQR